jgi:hypothetical protein
VADATTCLAFNLSDCQHQTKLYIVGPLLGQFSVYKNFLERNNLIFTTNVHKLILFMPIHFTFRLQKLYTQNSKKWLQKGNIEVFDSVLD